MFKELQQQIRMNPTVAIGTVAKQVMSRAVYIYLYLYKYTYIPMYIYICTYICIVLFLSGGGDHALLIRQRK